MTSRKQRLQQPRYIAFLHLLLASNVVFAALPKVDFDRMGLVGIAGSFAGFDLFDNSSFTYDPSTSTLLSRTGSGSLSPIASTNVGGRLTAGCAIGDTFYLAGSFSSIGNTAASNIISYKPSSGTIAALSDGLDGEVDAMYCDPTDFNIWVGGAFHGPVSASGSSGYKGAVAVYNVKGKSWAPPPFGGLAGAAGKVQSITHDPTTSSLYFAGSFLTAFQSNITVHNGPNNPNVPFSIGATPFSSSLVPIPLTAAGTRIVASPPNSRAAFSNVTNILCPAGPDGPGNTWLARDGSTAQIVVQTFQFSTASGLRLGNTFVEGRGTTAFSVLTIPDNQPLIFNYVDPVTLRNETCSTSCPLATNASVLYQDFLFNGVPQSLTGVMITLSQWQGAGSGLHILQLLSSGAFASAVSSQNQPSCFSPGSSTATLSGNWRTIEATTSIPGTTQPILVSSVDVGSPSSSSPSVTWSPYVSASGEYDINLLIPGCTNLQDCASRTSVKVTVSPGGGLPPIATTIRQDVTSDATSGVYRGPIIPSASNFQTTITMQLADQPVGNGQNGKFELVADRVQLVLTAVNVSGTTSLSGPGTGTVNAAGVQRGFGFFEWNLTKQGNVDATGLIPNSSETSNDALGLQLFSALGNSTSTPFIINAVATHLSGTIYVGGNFTLSSGPANIVAFKDNTLVGLAGGGLDGPVKALGIIGDSLYVGGEFSDTPSGTGNGAFRGVVRYDTGNGKWTAMLAGVNGAVADLNIADNKVDIVGNFTQLPFSPGSASGTVATGFATWDIGNRTWVNPGGFLTGNMAFVANGTGSASEFLAGNVLSSREFGADGFAIISNSKQADGLPTITPLSIQLDANVASKAMAPQRRNVPRSSWIGPIILSRFFTRQSPGQPQPLPAPAPAPAPAVLSGTFWTNSSTATQVVILGGNFSFPWGSSTAQNLAFYDATKAKVAGVNGAQINGTVRALEVSTNTLFVGGQFNLPGLQGNGLAIYDLAQQQWDTSFQTLSGSTVVVRSITIPPSKTGSVVVAGTFDKAGTLPCQSICQFDVSLKQWNQLGQGIRGDISTVVYASNSDLVAAGSIVLLDGTPANVAAYSFSNKTWSAIGKGSQIPGPVTACEVDNGNASSIFAAGSSADGSTPFLIQWNGLTWSSLGSTFQKTTSISQLSMVPLQDTHLANGIMETDRMLLISGSLSSDSFGNVSSALFDGRDFFPYIVSTSPSGGPGLVSQLFHSFGSFSFNQRHLLPVGVVILISIAIATGIVFFLLLIGILWTLFSRRDHDGVAGKLDSADYDDDILHRPSSLLAHINAATRGTIVGAGNESPFNEQQKANDEHGGVRSPGSETFPGDHEQDHIPYIRSTDTPVDAAPGTLQNEGEGMARQTHVRYSFEGDGEGELPLSAGEQVIVLDDRDPAWWYARDPNTGREGVIPASYLY